ncbi:MAG: GNAT family N-acetyltransferase [Planctomycetota bacterium]|jgi:hypothetical protein
MSVIVEQEHKTAIERSIRVVRGERDIEALRARWSELLELSGPGVPNVDIDRFLTSTHHLTGSEPCVLVIERGDRPDGLVVGRLWHERMRFRVGYLKLPTPRMTRFDVVYRGVISRDPGALVEIVRELASVSVEQRWDVVQCSHVTDAELEAFEQEFRGRVRPRPDEEHWVWEIVEGSYNETLNTFSRKHRANIRRYNRVLDKHFDNQVEIHRHTTPEQIDEFIPIASAITRKSYHFAIGAGIRDSELWRGLARMESDKERMRASVMYARGEPIAYQYGCRYGNTFFLEAMTYDQDHRDARPGAVLLQRTVEWLCEEGGVGTLDYGFGDAGYKKIHGTRSWNERTIRIYGHSWRARVASCLDSVTAWIVSRFRSSQSGDGSLGGLKRRWREYLRKRTARRSG